MSFGWGRVRLCGCYEMGMDWICVGISRGHVRVCVVVIVGLCELGLSQGLCSCE